MPKIQPVVFPALSAGLIKATASPCEPCLPLIRACFLDVGSSSVSRKQEPFPRYSSARQNLKTVGTFRGGEGKSEMFFWRERCQQREWHWVSSVSLLSTCKERLVTVTCPSVLTGRLFLPSFCHLLLEFLPLSTGCEIPRGSE